VGGCCGGGAGLIGTSCEKKKAGQEGAGEPENTSGRWATALNSVTALPAGKKAKRMPGDGDII